jgi:lipopolysaccharide export LptBFGC system permease protein LptF
MRFEGRQRVAAGGVLLGVLLTAVTVIGQLATTDGALEAVFAVLTAVGIVLVLGCAVWLARLRRVD